MFSPGQLTIGEIAGAIRDLGVFSGIVVAVWKSRGWYDAAVAFFDRCAKHMDVMEGGMKLLLDNHLTHISADLAKLVGKEK